MCEKKVGGEFTTASKLIQSALGGQSEQHQLKGLQFKVLTAKTSHKS